MEFKSEEEFLKHYDKSEFDTVSVTVDMIILGISNKINENYRKLKNKKLSVLLNKRNEFPCKDKWSLPGGFVAIDENLDEAAHRILKRETELKKIYMEQLYTFGNVNRDPRMRIISTAYMSLINRENLKEKVSNNVEWFDIEINIENKKIEIILKNKDTILKIKGTEDNGKYLVKGSEGFAFDHDLILLTGLMRLRNKINYTDIAFNLVPEKFTLTELQLIYEAILNEKLFPTAFRRIIMPKVEQTGEYENGEGHRPSQLYRYKKTTF